MPDWNEQLGVSELNFILKAIQTCVGVFPNMDLGAVADRPEQLSKWRFAVRTALDSAGPQVTAWWSWCWEVAEETHGRYMKTPIMQREGVKVLSRNVPKWGQIEVWIKPKLMSCFRSSSKSS